MFFLLAPLYSLFSLDFYRHILRRPVFHGVLHLFILSLVSLAIIAAAAVTRILPAVDEFAEWLGNELPPITWTPEGLVMNASSPYSIIHPDYGPLAILDMTKSEITPEEFGDAPFFVTSKNLYADFGEGEIRRYDLTQPASELPPDKLVYQIDAEMIRSLVKNLKPMVLGIMAFLSVPVFFLYRLIQAVICSGIGMIINRFRKLPLSYAQVFTASCFALTLSSILELRVLIWPFLAAVPFGFLGALLVTSAYLFLAVKLTEEPLPESL